MEAFDIRLPVKEGDRTTVFLASDLHLGSSRFDHELCKTQFDEARARNALILINGDVMDLILPQDRKRYFRGSDAMKSGFGINESIEHARSFLKPYADNIAMIGVGNHEVAPMKFHAIDVTKLLIGFLNTDKRTTAPIRHGGYTGICRLVLEDKTGKRAFKYDIFYNHGQGGSSPVTKGSIDLYRRQNVNADIIWLGHKHKRKIDDLDPEIGMDNYGKLYSRPQLGIITGSFMKQVEEGRAGSDDYVVDYGEESMSSPQGVGGVFLELTMTRTGLRARPSFA